MNSKLEKQIEVLIQNTYVSPEESNYELADIDDEDYPYPTKVDGILESKPGRWQLSNRHSKRFIKMSQQLASSEVVSFDNKLLSYCGDNYRKEIVKAITYYFVHTRKTDKLLNHLKKTLTDGRSSGAEYCLMAIISAIKHRPDIVTNDEVERFYDWYAETTSGKNELGKAKDFWTAELKAILGILRDTTNEHLAQTIERQIDTAYNPELNVDEEKVAEAIDDLGMNLDINEAQKHARNSIEKANTPGEYRDVMSYIRAYTERLYEQVAKKLDPDTKIDGKSSEDAAKFFQSKKLISGDVKELIIAHRHFLSNDGTHRLTSRREDTRIAFNMTTEISLYIVTRLREVLSRVEKSTK